MVPSIWRTLVAVSIATFMLLLDVTVVNVALPEIQADLGASFDELQWVIDAYALTLAATMLIFGSFADRLGRKRIFAFGLAAFSISSLLCGLAWDPVVLDVLRGVQGLGGAAMLATSLALIAAAYEGRRRATALAVWGATTAAAVAIGPLVGGALVEAFGWESIFFVNVPIGLITAFLVARGVPESKDPSASGRADYGGLVTLSSSMTMLILAPLPRQRGGLGQRDHPRASSPARRSCSPPSSRSSRAASSRSSTSSSSASRARGAPRCRSWRSRSRSSPT